MEKRDSGKVIAVIALFVAVIGLSVGFATLSTTLKINGSATVKATKWDIDFGGDTGEQPKEPDEEGTTGKAEQVSEPVFGDQSVSFNVKVKAPGDKITYKFKVSNDGNVKAKVSSIVPGSVECTGTGNDEGEKATKICSKIDVKLTTEDGTEIKQGTELPVGDTTYVWTLTFDAGFDLTVEDLPENDITFTQKNLVVTYEQA